MYVVRRNICNVCTCLTYDDEHSLCLHDCPTHPHVWLALARSNEAVQSDSNACTSHQFLATHTKRSKTHRLPKIQHSTSHQSMSIQLLQRSQGSMRQATAAEKSSAGLTCNNACVNNRQRKVVEAAALLSSVSRSSEAELEAHRCQPAALPPLSY